MGKRRRFDREFKRQAVRLASEEGQSMGQVARDLEIRPEMLRRWKKLFRPMVSGHFPARVVLVTRS